MLARFRYFFALLLLLGVVGTACGRRPEAREIIDPAEAAQDPDFKIQGEYVGRGVWAGSPDVRTGAQVIALGDGRFTVVVSKGGLPGEGWKRGDQQFFLTGTRLDTMTKLSTDPFSGKIVGETMTVASEDGKTKLELKRTERHSRTESAKPPKDGTVLFDGKAADSFQGGKLSKDENLMSEATTKQKFDDYILHIEFRLSYMPHARGQGRSNSGVYLHDSYEIQVLDSFGLEGADNECGGFYNIRRPDVNMCYPPLDWQTYDVQFTAPKFKDGKKVANARATVVHNGVVIHPDFELPQGTPGRQPEGPAPRPIYLQGHGNKVEYRNIWVCPVTEIIPGVFGPPERKSAR